MYEPSPNGWGTPQKTQAFHGKTTKAVRKYRVKYSGNKKDALKPVWVVSQWKSPLYAPILTEKLVRNNQALIDVVKLFDNGHSIRLASALGATPQITRSVQARENRWQAMEREFGFLSGSDVASALNYAATNRNIARKLAKDEKILGIKRGAGIVYPGFQFDQKTGNIKDVVGDVARIGRKYHWTHDELLQWFTAANSFVPGERRPVDIMDDREMLIQVARDTLAKPW